MSDLAQDMRDAAEAIRNMPPQKPCTHVVSPQALTRPGLYLCVVCCAPVQIPYPLVER